MNGTSRKKFEAIVIDDQITVSIVEIKGGKVRLGIEAPREVPILREELEQRVLEESLV